MRQLIDEPLGGNTLRWVQKLGVIAIFFITVVATVWRFDQWMPEVMYGDDLSNLLAYRDGFFASGFFRVLFGQEDYVGKFRPVFAWAMAVFFRLFEENVHPYQWINVLIQAASASITFAAVRRLSNGSGLFAFCVALAVALSRLALYNVTQVTGILESLALMFCLLSLYGVVRLSESVFSAAKWAWFALIMAALSMHTHERYVVLAAWLVLVFSLSIFNANLSRRSIFGLLASTVTLAIFNFLFKKLVVGIPFFVGTGGISMVFDFDRTIDSLRQAVQSIFGMNSGPDYLVGKSLEGLDSPTAFQLATAVRASWLGLIATGILIALYRVRRDKQSIWNALGWPMALVALAGLLLLPPLMTIRMEQRWVFTPYVVMLILAGWALGRFDGVSLRLMRYLACLLPLMGICLDSRFIPYFKNTFLVANADFAAAVKRGVIDQNSSANWPVAFLVRADFCNWSLLDGEFFRLYSSGKRKIRCFETLDAAITAPLSSDFRLFSYDARSNTVDEVTSEFRKIRSNYLESAISYDFLSHFQFGKINDSKKADSPTGLGIFTIAWPSAAGPRQVLTAISGFTYRYDDVLVENGTTLQFNVSMLLPAKQPARAVVKISTNGSGVWETIYAEELPPPPGEGRSIFRSVAIPLIAYSGKNVSILFGAETPGSDSTGHWIGFAEPRLTMALKGPH